MLSVTILARYPRDRVRVEEQTITLAQAPICYRSAPTGEIPVVYLHGAPTDSADWLPFLERTGGIAPDLIGFGRSAKGGNLDYSITGQADFVRSLLDHLGLERVKLVMHGWGAAGGLVFAQSDPSRVERIVLINALPLHEGFSWPRLARIWRRPLIGELAMGFTSKSMLARLLRSGSVQEAAWPRERIGVIWQQFDQGTQRALLRMHRDADPERLAHAGANLHSLRMPALILWGSQDPWLPARWADVYASVLAGSQLLALPRAGHWPWLDDATVLDRVATFLDPV